MLLKEKRYNKWRLLLCVGDFYNFIVKVPIKLVVNKQYVGDSLLPIKIQ